MNNKNISLSALALAVGLAFSVGAMADGMSKRQYKSQDKIITASFKAAKDRCDSYSGNARDICIADAKGKRDIAEAQLEDSFKPTAKTLYNLRVAKAGADFSVAIEHCDGKAGNAKDVCVKEAKAGKVHGVADAEAQLTTSKADSVANEKAADANATAMDKASEAHKDAATTGRDADYAVAKEKCKVFAGDAKDQCMNNAKLSFGPH